MNHDTKLNGYPDDEKEDRTNKRTAELNLKTSNYPTLISNTSDATLLAEVLEEIIETCYKEKKIIPIFFSSSLNV